MARKTGPLDYAQPEGHVPGFGDRVRVLAAPWQDTRSGHEGTVKRVRLEAGELLVTVEFGDGARHDYWYPDELKLLRLDRSQQIP